MNVCNNFWPNAFFALKTMAAKMMSQSTLSLRLTHYGIMIVLISEGQTENMQRISAISKA